MPDLYIHKLNDVYLKVDCDQSIACELDEYFKFRVRGYQFVPAYRNKMWDGYIHLFNVMSHKVYAGLLNHLTFFATNNNYTVGMDSSLPGITSPEISMSDVKQFFVTMDSQVKDSKTGKTRPLIPRDYQLKAVHCAVNNNRQLILSPTGSGKSLIIYALIQWLQQYCTEEKILLIVPTTSLVEQMYTDFGEYSSNILWDVEMQCHRVYSGHDKDTDKQVVISTWQSMYRQSEEYLSQFKAVIVDEAHQAKATSIKNILERMPECPYRFGTTGTIDDCETNKLILQGLIGPVQRIATTKELMDKEQLATLAIDCINLNYNDADCKTVKGMKYQDEIAWLFMNTRRNQFITDMAMALPGNTLILVSYTKKHGHEIWKLLEAAGKKTEKPVFYIYGDVETIAREKVRKIVEKEKTSVILATYGTFQLGVNIKNLNNIIFGAPSKSTIRVLQSIGRALRIGQYKRTARLFDIVDNLRHGKKNNWAIKHFLIRFTIYLKEKFKVKSRQINFRDKS